jgi:hypothetical protein
MVNGESEDQKHDSFSILGATIQSALAMTSINGDDSL